MVRHCKPETWRKAKQPASGPISAYRGSPETGESGGPLPQEEQEMSEGQKFPIKDGRSQEELDHQRALAARAQYEMIRDAEARYWREMNNPFGLLNRWF